MDWFLEFLEAIIQHGKVDEFLEGLRQRPRRRRYRLIPPEEQYQWVEKICPHCGRRGLPTFYAERAGWIKGICASCGKTWETEAR